MLRWGLGLEKEFPILVGIYYKNDLINTLNAIISFFDKLFLARTAIISRGLLELLKDIRKRIYDNIILTIQNLDKNKYFYLKLENIIDDYLI